MQILCGLSHMKVRRGIWIQTYPIIILLLLSPLCLDLFVYISLFLAVVFTFPVISTLQVGLLKFNIALLFLIELSVQQDRGGICWPLNFLYPPPLTKLVQLIFFNGKNQLQQNGG